MAVKEGLLNDVVVSVVMVTYNHEAYVSQAIESILRQETTFRFELVIGEDCSTDRTRQIVRDYESSHPGVIRVVSSESNVGASENFYRTVKSCRGEYIAFCEGDDYWQAPHKLQVQANFLETHAEFGMVHSEYDVYHMGTGQLISDFTSTRGLHPPNEPDIVQIITDCRITFRIQTCTVMLRRALFAALVDADPFLHRNSHFLMGDTQLWAEVSTRAKIGYLPESLATYRQLGESASRSGEAQRTIRFELSDCEMKLYLCDKHGLPESVRRNREVEWCRAALKLAFYEGNGDLAIEARRLKKTLSVKEWLWYGGGRSVGIKRLLLAAARCCNVFMPNVIN
jgi:glycosyltransferase involved in cell wall biosynthesis